MKNFLPDASVAISSDDYICKNPGQIYFKGDSHLKIVAGFMDGKVLEAKVMAQIATLPTLDEQGNIVGILSAQPKKF